MPSLPRSPTVGALRFREVGSALVPLTTPFVAVSVLRSPVWEELGFEFVVAAVVPVRGEMVLLSLDPVVPGLMPVVLWLVGCERSLGLGRPFGRLFEVV